MVKLILFGDTPYSSLANIMLQIRPILTNKRYKLLAI